MMTTLRKELGSEECPFCKDLLFRCGCWRKITKNRVYKKFSNEWKNRCKI